jgi:hypothetical protein
MSDIDRKARIRAYKDTPRPAGIYRVRNTVARKSLIGSSTDLPGMLNRQRFQLENGSHPHRELQKDWNELGPDVFVIETLDQIEPSKEPTYDPADDLAALEKMWIEKLTASGETLYQPSKRNT